jgi:double-stranded uracil-DNA glycosylase
LATPEPRQPTTGVTPPPRPSKADIAAAAGRTVPDLIRPGLRVLFCGINPGLYSGATGHHFARPGNRFWPALYLAGFTPRIIGPWEEHLLLQWDLGITNLVARATASASELTTDELRAGRLGLERKVTRFRPSWVAIVGIGAYRLAFQRVRAGPGLQPEQIEGSRLWVLPNPSGLNANHQLPDLAREFGRLRRAVEGESRPASRGRGGDSRKTR